MCHVTRTALLAIAGLLSGCAGLSIEGAKSEICKAKPVHNVQTVFDWKHKNGGAEIKASEFSKRPRWTHREITQATIEAGRKAKASLSPAQFNMHMDVENFANPAAMSAVSIASANEASRAIEHVWKKVPDSAFELRSTGQPVLTSLGTDDGKFNFSRVLAGNGFEVLAIDRLGRLEKHLKDRRVLSPAELKAVIELDEELRTANFLSIYFKAYFRGGRVFQTSLDTAALANRAANKIKLGLPDVKLNDDQLKRLTDSLEKELRSTCREDTAESGKCLLSRALGDSSFVTRYGMSVQFSGIAVTFGTNGELSPAVDRPDSTEFAPQMMRVFIEALFDAHGLRVPASSKSTACTSGLYKVADCLHDKTPDETKQKLKKLEEYTTKAESVVSAATAKYVRGLSVVALNNEAIAKTAETFAGVTARKIVEKGLWALLEDCDAKNVNRVAAAVWSNE